MGTHSPQLPVGLMASPEKKRQAETRAGVLRSVYLEKCWIEGRRRHI